MTGTVTSSPKDTTAVRSLAWIEAKRFARHPIFLIGLVLAFGLLIQQIVTAPGGGADMTPEGNAIQAAFFLGCFGLLAADRLTRGAFRSREVAVASPGEPTPTPNPIPTPTPQITAEISLPPGVTPAPPTPTPIPTPTPPDDCEDGVDNDGDLLIDELDPGCILDGNEASA
jgi:hypothetical protein